MSDVVGILLAAGSSRRFGSDKLRQPVSEADSVAARACRNLLAATARVIAVIRPGADELAAVLAQTGVAVRICPRADEGMGASLAFGVQEAVNAEGWLIALADMPWIRPETIRAVAAALPGAPIVAPLFNGIRGHPVGFSHAFRNELLALSGDAGARNLLEKYSSRIRRLDCDDPGILLDIDLPADLAGSRFQISSS